MKTEQNRKKKQKKKTEDDTEQPCSTGLSCCFAPSPRLPSCFALPPLKRLQEARSSNTDSIYQRKINSHILLCVQRRRSRRASSRLVSSHRKSLQLLATRLEPVVGPDAAVCSSWTDRKQLQEEETASTPLTRLNSSLLRFLLF